MPPPKPQPLPPLKLSTAAAAAAFDALQARTLKGLAETILHAGCSADLKAGCWDPITERGAEGAAQLGNVDRLQYLASAAAERMSAGFPGALSEGYVELLGALHATAQALRALDPRQAAAVPWTFAPI